MSCEHRSTASGAVTTVVEGKLYALHNPYELNGYVSTHPASARGYAPLNCYLLIEGKRALLIDTGFSVHEESLISQISSLLPDSATLSVFPSLGEFAGACNTRPVIEHFNVDIVYGLIGNPAAWTDFRPEFAPYGGPVGHGRLSGVGAGYVRATDLVDWAGNGRILEALRPPVRLLPSHWYYDAATRTLFTGDLFNHVWRETADGPWLVEPGESPPSFPAVYDFLTSTRYWWLPGARTDELRDDLRHVFEERAIDVIAPRFGCLIVGHEPISTHLGLVEQVLAECPSRPPSGISAGAERMGAICARCSSSARWR